MTDADVDIDISSESRYPIDRKHIGKVVTRVIRAHRVRGKVSIEVLFVGDRKMRQLNNTHRKMNATTNVLAFPLEDPLSATRFISPADGVLQLGSIVVSYPQVIQEAAKENKLVDDKIAELVEHGVLHLLGIHHE